MTFFQAKSLCLFLAMALSACTSAALYPDATILEIDGKEWFVRPMNQPNTWQAGPNRPPIDFVRPDFYPISIKAIEQVSGCKVVPGAVNNANQITMAAVDCG